MTIVRGFLSALGVVLVAMVLLGIYGVHPAHQEEFGRQTAYVLVYGCVAAVGLKLLFTAVKKR